MANKNEIIDSFLVWYEQDEHSKNEDRYQNTVKEPILRSLSKEDFIEFFYQFAYDGGGIQSLGWRTAPKLRENITAHFDEFQARMLAPFAQDFDLEGWLTWSENFKHWGQGIATIYLNRVNKSRFAIVNNKVVNALPYLGFDGPVASKLTKRYSQIFEAERSLLREFPELDNFYKVDALMHFMIGTKSGRELLNIDYPEFFNLKGIQEYSLRVGSTYNSKDPAAKWYKDTQEKLYFLVTLLARQLNKNLSVTYKELPQAQAGRGKIVFKDYVLVGFSPDSIYPNGTLFIKIAFHELGKDTCLSLEIDINEKTKGNPFASRRADILEKSRRRFPVDIEFPEDWDSLYELIKPHILELIEEYKRIASHETKGIDNMLQGPLNQILYGPPGTGKTYRTIDHALAIIDGKKSVEEIAAERENDRNGDIKRTFDDLMKEGRIDFCTFHQSMGYEDFIEGIKPLSRDPDEDKPMQYAVVDGIFKKMCTEATFELASLIEGEPTDKLVDFSYLYDQFVSDIQERQSRGEITELTTVSGGTIVVDGISDRNNLIVKHKGSEKPYIVSKDRLSRLANGVPDLKAVNNMDAKFREVIGGSNATAYWATLNAIRQVKPAESRNIRDISGIGYEDKKRAIEHFKLEKYDVGQAKRFVLIIDEINRGNVAQIFGELITLIEDDKRMGAKTALKATLPYSNESFSVPPNLYIIGTMNTADRSVEALDTALRRRFTFVHTKPEPDKLKPTQEGIDLNKMLTNINKRLEVLLDADHTIGHAWLWGVNDLAGLRLVFKDKILPLMQEFFYNDYEKIGLVLGDAFVWSEEVKPKDVFANFKNGSGLAEEYASARLFYLTDVMQISAEQFSAI